MIVNERGRSLGHNALGGHASAELGHQRPQVAAGLDDRRWRKELGFQISVRGAVGQSLELDPGERRAEVDRFGEAGVVGSTIGGRPEHSLVGPEFHRRLVDQCPREQRRGPANDSDRGGVLLAEQVRHGVAGPRRERRADLWLESDGVGVVDAVGDERAQLRDRVGVGPVGLGELFGLGIIDQQVRTGAFDRPERVGQHRRVEIGGRGARQRTRLGEVRKHKPVSRGQCQHGNHSHSSLSERWRLERGDPRSSGLPILSTLRLAVIPRKHVLGEVLDEGLAVFVGLAVKFDHRHEFEPAAADRRRVVVVDIERLGFAGRVLHRQRLDHPLADGNDDLWVHHPDLGVEIRLAGVDLRLGRRPLGVPTARQIGTKSVLHIRLLGVWLGADEPEFAENPLEAFARRVAGERNPILVGPGVWSLGDKEELAADIAVAVDNVVAWLTEVRAVGALLVHPERVVELLLIGVHTGS